MSQGIRPTQYVTTFGPGSIVETPDGPFLLKSVDSVLDEIRRSQSRPSDFAINDMRLQRGLLKGGRVFKIPDEAVSERFTHPTRAFPTWNLCVKHRDSNIIHRRLSGCPRCTGADREESTKPKYAIRFVSACPRGHLSDVDWSFVVHMGRTLCPRVEYLLWHGTGSSLSSIEIECPSCHTRKTLGEIYQLKQRCGGYFPERDHREDDCDQQAVVVQRGSTQLRIPEVITSLTIPPARPIHNILQREGFSSIFTSLRRFGPTEENFRGLLEDNVRSRLIPARTAEEILRYPWSETLEAMEELEESVREKTMLEYLIQEHRALEHAADTGYPPYPSEAERRIGEPPRFQVNQVEIRTGLRVGRQQLLFRIVPIERLRTVLVQKSYRRVEFDDPNIPSALVAGSDPDYPGVPWYPGVDHFGEGIYIDLDPTGSNQDFYPSSPRAQEWDRILAGNALPRGDDSLVEWNALSVWWHTLSHRLINALAIHSGYSSSAIRERVYMTRDDRRGTRGSLILYTTQAGGDGTMGGLTSLVPQFEEIFRLAFETVDNCSNDPLCGDADLDSRLHLGSACYSCLMVSETSCEHMNGYLDRKLLLENHP